MFLPRMLAYAVAMIGRKIALTLILVCQGMSAVIRPTKKLCSDHEIRLDSRPPHDMILLSINRSNRPKGMIIMTATATTATIAAEFDTTPRELRKFLRSTASGIESVGKGSRYALPSTKREMLALRKKFDAWNAARTPITDADAPSTDAEPITEPTD